jgi:predicted deacetylase
MDSSEASYLLRFDDICPTMKWSNWEPIEVILREHEIRPIMAVVPDNRDPDLCLEPANPQFWNRVRSWQAAGWAIGLHGFQHTYVTRRPGLYSHRNASEFAGLPPGLQREKLKRALAILRGEGVSSNLWVAPGHSFDRTTVHLLREVGITSVSDGFTIFPYTDEQGIFWIPQQLSEKGFLSLPGGKPIQPKSKGVWTVCFHLNAWTSEEIDRFRQEAGRYRALLRTADEVYAIYGGRQMDWLDRVQVAEFEVKRLLRLLRFAYSGRKVVDSLIPCQVPKSGPLSVAAHRGEDQ